MIATASAPAPDLTPPADLPDQVATALREDIGGGDLTAQLVPEDQRVTGRVVADDWTHPYSRKLAAWSPVRMPCSADDPGPRRRFAGWTRASASPGGRATASRSWPEP